MIIKITPPNRFARALMLSGMILLSGFYSSTAWSINNQVESNLPATDSSSSSQLIPYGFFNSDVGGAVAAAWISKGVLQEQASTVANVWVGSEGAYQLFLSNNNIQLPFSDRLFVDSVFMYSNWEEVDSYQNGNPNFPNEIAGSNDSDEDNSVSATGEDLFGYISLRYLLPIGDGRGDPIHTFKLSDGLLMSGFEAGGGPWNPLKSGRTTLELRPFYRDQDFESDDTGEPFRNKTSGVKFILEYDNTDWYNNPTRGSRQELTIARDWGALDESPTWTAIQFRHSQFFNLGETKKARQRVLALDFWTSDLPTWNSSHTDKNGREIFHRAPLFEGSTLGGLLRQRAYANDRFHDRSAINYSLEYRYTPRWNPMPEIPLINKLYIPWWQWVAYVEVGRVADNWSVSDLHKDMKVSVGGGIRALVSGLIIRVDAGVSDEGGEIQMFFNHPF